MNLRMFGVVSQLMAIVGGEAIATVLETGFHTSFPLDGHTFNVSLAPAPAPEPAALTISRRDAGHVAVTLGMLAAEAFFGESGETALNVDVPGQQEPVTLVLAVSRV